MCVCIYIYIHFVYMKKFRYGVVIFFLLSQTLEYFPETEQHYVLSRLDTFGRSSSIFTRETFL